MRRYALLASVLLLAGCSGSGFWSFLGDSETFPGANPNLPPGAAENMRRVKAQPIEPLPLLPEGGNIWPGPPPPQPTLEDIERQQNQQFSQPQQGVPLPFQLPPIPPYESGSSTTPPNIQPGLPPGFVPPVEPPGPAKALRPPRGARVVQTPNGPAVETGGNGNFRTLNGPGMNGSIMIPNGNGTSTVISPNGNVTTIPTPH